MKRRQLIKHLEKHGAFLLRRVEGIAFIGRGP